MKRNDIRNYISVDTKEEIESVYLFKCRYLSDVVSNKSISMLVR